jgi:hypothetical protein
MLPTPRLLYHGGSENTMSEISEVASLDWLSTSGYFSHADEKYSQIIISQLTQLGQLAREKGESQLGKVGGTEVLVHWASQDFVRADLHGCRAKFKVPPYSVQDPQAAVEFEFSGDVFYNHPAEEVCAPFLEWLWKSGAILEKTRVSRADISVDLLGVPFERMERANRLNHFITRAKKFADWGDNQTVNTIYKGKSPIMCRIYDKGLQVDLEKNPPKKAAFDQRVRGVRPVTRVEFQVRAEKLKQLSEKEFRDLGGVYTFTGLLCNWADVGKYCATEFIRMVKKRTTKTATLALAPEWVRVLQILSAIDSQKLGLPFEHQPPDVLHLMRAASSMLATAALFEGKEFGSRFDLRYELLHMLDQFLDDESEAKELFEKMKKRKAKIVHKLGTPAQA